MEFNKIIAVSGKPGLYEIVLQTKTGVVVKSIETGKRTPITASHNVSLLDNIAIYSTEGEVPLLNILSSIALKEDSKNTLSHKEDDETLIKYFTKILPNYDVDKVYPSNIRKVIQWYNIMINSGFDFSTAKQEEKA